MFVQSDKISPFFTVYHIAGPKNRTCKNIFALLGWGGVALRCSPAKVSDLVIYWP